jgi:hypothetical protein
MADLEIIALREKLTSRPRSDEGLDGRDDNQGYGLADDLWLRGCCADAFSVIDRAAGPLIETSENLHA